MLYFRDSPWVKVNGGASEFSAYISQSDRERENVMWSIELCYIAGGAAWRRVRHWDRPSLWIEVQRFQPPPHSWTHLQRADYWDLPPETMSDEDEWDYQPPGGGIEAHYYPKGGSKNHEQLPLDDVVWRVAARDGRWFIVELAALFDGHQTRRDLQERPVAVTTDGKTQTAEPDAEFWKKHAAFYLVENIPFGTVTVRVPQNARDPETYALSRAQELIGGLPLPQYVEVSERREPKKDDVLGVYSDLFVILHFNGYYES